MNSVEYNSLGVVLIVIKYKEIQLTNHCSICAVELKVDTHGHARGTYCYNAKALTKIIPLRDGNFG